MKTIGIMGGMGPMATVDLMKKIILATNAREDQDHIPIIVDNNTAIPDRTAAIRGEGISPVPEMLKTARRLEAAGADFIIIGCNTAHTFLPEYEDKLNIPVINMIEETAKFCSKNGYNKVGLLASAGTCRTGIYQRALIQNNVKVIQPNEEQEAIIHDMIYKGVKANNYSFDAQPVKRVIKEMQDAGAEAFVLGCTETPVGVEMYHLKGKFIDATEVLAEAAVAAAGAQVITHLPGKNH